MVLLKWKGSGGETFILRGTTFERNVTHNVWFDSIAMTCCAGRPLFNVSAFGATRVGTMAVAIDGEPANVTDISNTMNVKSVRHPGTSFNLQQYGDKRVGDKHAQVLEVKNHNAHFSIYSSGAGKFESKGEQFNWRHLNMHFMDGFPQGATGILAGLVTLKSVGTSLKGNHAPFHCDDASHPHGGIGCHAEVHGGDEQGGSAKQGKGRKSKAGSKGVLQASE